MTIDLERDWVRFDHKITGDPIAKATVKPNFEIWVEVYVPATHWIGDIKDPPVVQHGIGLIIPLRKFWMMAAASDTPFKVCEGKDGCSAYEHIHYPDRPCDKCGGSGRLPKNEENEATKIQSSDG